MNGDNQTKSDRGPLIGGVVLIVIGSFLLLEKLGWLPHGFVFHFWPSILIVIGIVKIVYAGGRPTGAVLLLLGVLLQLNAIGVTHLHFWELWPVLIIVAGIAMLWQAMGGEVRVFTGNPQFDVFYMFGGGERHVNSKNFQSAKLMAIFGGYKIDLTHAEFDGNQAVIEANAIFGGGEIRVPESCLVVMQGVGVFGAYEDKTRHFQPDPSRPSKTLLVRGVAVFGGIEVKN